MPRSLRGLARPLLAVAATWLSFSCSDTGDSAQESDGDMRPAQRSPDDFRSVQIEEVGREFTIEAAGILILEDAEGQESFDVTSEELEQVLDIVLDADFVEAVMNPAVSSQQCPPITDGGATTVVVWADTGTHAVQWGNCAEEHPYLQLHGLFVDLLKKYFACPRVDLGAMRVRELCNGCWSYPLDWPGAC